MNVETHEHISNENELMTAATFLVVNLMHTIRFFHRNHAALETNRTNSSARVALQNIRFSNNPKVWSIVCTILHSRIQMNIEIISSFFSRFFVDLIKYNIFFSEHYLICLLTQLMILLTISICFLSLFEL